MDGQLYAVPIVAAVLANFIATHKGYDNDRWFLLAFMFWPVALPMLLMKPNLRTERERVTQDPAALPR